MQHIPRAQGRKLSALSCAFVAGSIAVAMIAGCTNTTVRIGCSRAVIESRVVYHCDGKNIVRVEKKFE